MSTYDSEEAVKPVKVEIVDTRTAQRERRTITATFVPPIAGSNTPPACILNLSNKRIHAIISVTGIGTANLCTSQSMAQNVTTSYNAGAVVGPGTFEIVGTGELWLVAPAAGVLVSVISEYEA